jgi:wyosine [tRNA(Phe)-imidazoG37] synthetase (radical SAM superfamily)
MDNNPSPDYITFSGSGEPSLYSRIGEIIDHIKKKYPDIPVAVLTNGTLFKYSEVRNELSGANLVLPSLDAVSDLSFRRINRPQSSLDSDSHIEGLIDFRREFDGKIWLEVFLLPEYNMDEEELSKLKSAIEKIRPDLIQLNTLDRPGAVEDLHPADYDEMKRIIGEWGFDNAVIIASPKKRSNMMAYRKDKANAIMETISRRPCTNQDLADILGLHLNDINKYLDSLEKEGKINGVQQQRGVFYQLNKNE